MSKRYKKLNKLWDEFALLIREELSLSQSIPAGTGTANETINEEKKDWEIVKSKNVKTGEIHDYVDIRNYDRSGAKRVSNCIEDGCEIYSVRRLSDNEVFSTKEDISVSEGDHEWFGKIYEFKIIGNEMVVGIWEKGETSSSGDLHRSISQINKLKPPTANETINEGKYPHWDDEKKKIFFDNDPREHLSTINEEKKDWEIVRWMSPEGQPCTNPKMFVAQIDKILSVLRLSDNEVFSVGDEDKESGKILSFSIDGKHMQVWFNGAHYKGLALVSKPTANDVVNEAQRGDLVWKVGFEQNPHGRFSMHHPPEQTAPQKEAIDPAKKLEIPTDNPVLDRQDKKIELLYSGIHKGDYQLELTKSVSKEKLQAFERAIEQVLNS